MYLKSKKYYIYYTNKIDFTSVNIENTMYMRSMRRNITVINTL
jgi:hypothetical protein